MNVTEFSERLANSISGELSYDDEKNDIIAYGIESSILALFGFGAVLLVAFLLGALFPAAIATAFGGILRKVSGGAHFNTPLKCLVAGAITYSILGVFAIKIIENNLFSIGIFLVLLCLSLITVAVLSPVDSEAKPIHSLIFRKKLKIASISIVIFAFFVVLFSDNDLVSTSAVLGIVFQSTTLLPVLNKRVKEVRK